MSDASLNDLELKPQYRTNPLDPEGVVGDFYIPVLSLAKRYDRLSGFFSSASFSLAARGVAALIANGGKMRLVCSPKLSVDDATTIEAFARQDVSILNEYWRNNFSPDELSIQRDHVAALGWMLMNGMLEIKLAIPASGIEYSLCHPKIGLVEDFHDNAISFSGSNNETASGWAMNQEEFKVFKRGEIFDYYENDRACFDAYWNDMMPGVRCFDVPQALKSRLLERSSEFNRENYIARYFVERRRKFSVYKRLNLRPYQLKAVKEWVSNDFRLMFEMATGSGKTYTAIGCLNRMMEKESSGCIIIAVPRLALCDQWKQAASNLFVKPATEMTASSANPNWESDFARLLSRMLLGTARSKFIVVYASHATASSRRFVDLVERCESQIPVMIIADEAHGLGAPQYQCALYAQAHYRVGLSATPSRLFDEVGTKTLVKYFGNKSFVFSIGDALKARFVSHYCYHPLVVQLSEAEQEKYVELTERIHRLRSMYEKKLETDLYERLEKALRDRALLIAAAEEKIPRLKRLLLDSAAQTREFTIVFACPKNIDAVVASYHSCTIIAQRYTARESLDVRTKLLKRFAAGECPVLVAMKCLDEGVDVPAAHCAIIVSSTVNPREYIQRIGRVIRKAPGKQRADIYDFLVTEHGQNGRILERDLKRGLYIAQFADNATEALDILFGKTGDN